MLTGFSSRRIEIQIKIGACNLLPILFHRSFAVVVLYMLCNRTGFFNTISNSWCDTSSILVLGIIAVRSVPPITWIVKHNLWTCMYKITKMIDSTVGFSSTFWGQIFVSWKFCQVKFPFYLYHLANSEPLYSCPYCSCVVWLKVSSSYWPDQDLLLMDFQTWPWWRRMQ